MPPKLNPSAAELNNGETQSPRGYGPGIMANPPPPSFKGGKQNFSVWRIKFTAALIRKGLDHVLEGKHSKDKDQAAEDNKDVWTDLILSMDDLSTRLIQNVPDHDGEACWKILKDHYEGTKQDKIYTAYRNLINFELGSDEGISEYLCRLDDIKATLIEAEREMDPQFLVEQAKNGLTEPYNLFVEVLNTLKPEDKPSYDLFKIQLKAKETELKASQKEMIMKAQVHSYGNEVSKRMYCLKCRRSGHLRHECRTRYCDFCKMYGHQKSDCFRLEEKLRRQQQQQQEENYSEEEACDAANVLHTKPTGNSDECDDYDFGFTAVVHSQAELEPGCKRRPVQYRGRRADERPAGCKFR
ncbi:unnamed protein product, partial [Meganyctiphanes norvegica]